MSPPTVSRLGSLFSAALVVGSEIAATHATPRPENRATPASNVTSFITRDVVIVGGGASGAHAAVSLRDMGKTVVVVEKQSQLGGHTETYWDPDTGNAINVGVQGWVTYKNTTDFVTKRMNVSTTALAQPSLTTRYVDFSTGAALDDYVEPTSAEWLAALETYLAVCEQYQDLILPGYFDFPRDNIPEDLTMPFEDFVAKYNIAAAVPKLFELTGMGVGDMMSTTTMYVMQAVGAPFVSVYFGGASSIVPASGDAHEVYDRIGDLLGGDVLYDTTVVSSARPADGDGVRLVARGADGRETHISAKRLLLAIEPSEENMRPFDLDEVESGVFGKFQHSNVYVGAVKNPSLPANVSLTNMPASAAPSNWTDLPLPSFNARFDDFGHGTDLFRFLMVGAAGLGAGGARELARDGFDRMVGEGGALAGAGEGSPLEFAAFEDHGPMHLRVGAAELEAGFIQDLYALQGRRSTWYTGAAWSAQFTTVLWAYNDILLPKIVQGME